jgi:hypothetical protein
MAVEAAFVSKRARRSLDESPVAAGVPRNRLFVDTPTQIPSDNRVQQPIEPLVITSSKALPGGVNIPSCKLPAGAVPIFGPLLAEGTQVYAWVPGLIAGYIKCALPRRLSQPARWHVSVRPAGT